MRLGSQAQDDVRKTVATPPDPRRPDTSYFNTSDARGLHQALTDEARQKDRRAWFASEEVLDSVFIDPETVALGSAVMVALRGSRVMSAISPR